MKLHRFSSKTELDDLIKIICDDVTDLLDIIAADSGHDRYFIAGIALIPTMRAILDGPEDFFTVVETASHSVSGYSSPASSLLN